jgi:UDP-N-acetylmuramoyl-tripeptide--D-alanyl-D-alanine ligase
MVADADGALEALAALGPLGRGDAVLVKGSRVAELERVAEVLLGR